MDFSKINLDDNQRLARMIIKKASSKTFKTRRDFEKFRNSMTKENKGVIFHNLYFVRAYNDLVAEKIIDVNPDLLKLIQKRGVRTLSGVAPVTVLTKPFPCPGRCVYCPTDVRMPKSYLPSQPAAQRAFRQGFNPYTQVFVRLKAMMMTGHEISKVELRVIGGTWSVYPKSYQRWFLKRCLQAMNEFPERIKGVTDMSDITKTRDIKSVYGSDTVSTVFVPSLEGNSKKWDEVVKENETAKIKCIGINIETRSDEITKAEVKRLRSLGVTKVEMGVQTTDDRVQKLTARGHDLQSVVDATKLLKDAGFKIGYHMMPNLPGASVELDKKMVGELFDGDKYQPDYLKIYPCVVVPKSMLSIIYRRGEYKPYDDAVLEEVLYENMKSIPYWCRVDRVARDIPADEIESGFKASNVRQTIESRMIKEGYESKDIRSREVKDFEFDKDSIDFISRKYEASGGVEHFLSFEDVKNNKLLALLRLRFPSETFIKELKNSAIIREVHVYGKQVAVGKSGKGQKQHMGFGKQLMQKAETMSDEAGYKKIAVIAGIGTREYYSKLGYRLEGTYMVKDL